MAYYFFPPDNKPATIAPSLGGTPEPTNPTVVPLATLRRFQYGFLIRHPRRSVPSYYRCTVPPLDTVTGFPFYMPNEAGYAELRRFFDYLISEGVVDKDNVIVLDADDMLDNPEAAIRMYCEGVGIEYSPKMLQWSQGDTEHAAKVFEKWQGFHDDALESSSLKPRTHTQVSPIAFVTHWTPNSDLKGRCIWRWWKCGADLPDKKCVSVEEEDEQWRQKFGEEGQKVIRQTVNENIPHYEYLKQFALKVPPAAVDGVNGTTGAHATNGINSVNGTNRTNGAHSH